MVQNKLRPILEELKSILKLRKLNYSKLAKKIGISESAVKKIFTNNDCSFLRLQSICAALEVELSSVLISAANSRPIKAIKLTSAQERALKKDKKLLVLYALLKARDFNIGSIEKLGANKQIIENLTNRLEKIGLVRRTLGCTIEPYDGNGAEISNSLYKAYFDVYALNLIDSLKIDWAEKNSHVDITFYNYKARSSTIQNMIQTFAALQQEFEARITREERFSKPEELQDVAIFTAIKPIDWKSVYLPLLQPISPAIKKKTAEK